MSWTCGSSGLPDAGKATIFNALIAGQAEVASWGWTPGHWSISRRFCCSP
ncbi:MAG: hypothetical protein WBQ36_04505 [Desulfobaccales bacterium]